MQHFEVTFPFVIDPNFIEAKRHTSQFISRKGHKTLYLYKAFLFCFIQLFCFTSTCQFFHFQLSQNTSRPIKSYLPIELLCNSNSHVSRVHSIVYIFMWIRSYLPMGSVHNFWSLKARVFKKIGVVWTIKWVQREISLHIIRFVGVKPNGNLKPLNQGFKAWFLFSCMPCCSKQRKCD